MKLKFDFEFVDLEGNKVEDAKPANEVLAGWLINFPTQIINPLTALEWARSLKKGEEVDLVTENQDKLKSFLVEVSKSVSALYVGQVLEYISNYKADLKKSK